MFLEAAISARRVTGWMEPEYCLLVRACVNSLGGIDDFLEVIYSFVRFFGDGGQSAGSWSNGIESDLRELNICFAARCFAIFLLFAVP